MTSHRGKSAFNLSILQSQTEKKIEHGYFPALQSEEKETVPEVHHFEKRQPVAVILGIVYNEGVLHKLQNN